MPTPTYTPLANITLGSAQASVTFSSISQAYRDLVFVLNGTSTSSGGFTYGYINAQSGSDISYVWMKGNGSTATSGSSGGDSEFYFDGAASDIVSTSAGFNSVMHFFDYSQTDKHKTVLHRTNNANSRTIAMAFRKATTSAVTSVTFVCNNGNWAAGSTFALYGIAA